jgi:hypothetical protein
MNTTRQPRAGISLLEVLISIGILAVGLTSVLSFIPAGHSMAKTSLVTDQAAIVAANTLEDLVTEGYLRVDSLSGITSPVVIDPFGAGTWPASLGFAPAVLRQNGVFSVPTTLSPDRVFPATAYLARSRDDVIFNVPDSDAVDVTNSLVGGVRPYRGNFSWVAMISRPGGGSLTAGDEATLTVVVFHNRDTAQSPHSLGSYTPWAGNVTWPLGAGPLISDRKNSEVIRSNGVCLVHQTVPAAPPSFRRISIAAIDNGDTGAFIEFDGPQPAATATVTLYAVPDAVAVIEKTVTLEGPSPYSE